MRLTCPTCGAQYEVQDTLIPAAGRDVQCSACSTTWFQPGARMPEPDLATAEAGPVAHEPEEAVAEEVPQPAPGRTFARSSGPEAAFAPRSADPPPQPRPPREDPPPVERPAPETPETPETALSDDMETATRIVEDNDPADDEGDDDTDTEASAAGARRGLDPSVRDILRSEAEREARLRQAEATPVETQAEMPLEAGSDGPSTLRRDRLREDEPTEVFDIRIPDDVKPMTSRGDLLPDIEEINATLRAHPPHGPDAPEAVVPPPSREVVRRRGVRIGFFTTLAIVAALGLVYANAEEISRQVPEAAPALERFATHVDGVRLWLDDLARDLAEGGPGA